MRNHRHRSALARLAFVAILLLATLPTLGRIAVSIDGAAHARAMAMPPGCSMADVGPATHARLPGRSQAWECEYCVLLSGALPPAMVLLALPLGHPAAVAIASPSSPPVLSPVRRGLGARGPPSYG